MQTLSHRRLFFLLVGLFLVPVGLVAQTLSGTTYREYKFNGVADAALSVTMHNGPFTTRYAEPALPGVSIHIFGPGGTELAGSPVLSDASGLWSYTIPGSYPDAEVVVEFVPPMGYSYGATGAQNETSIRKIVLSGTTTGIDFTAHIPSDHCEDDPTLGIPCIIQGAGSSTPLETFITVEYNNSSLFTDMQEVYGNQGIGNQNALDQGVQPHITIGDQLTMGNVNGTAYDRLFDRWFGAAYHRKNGALGPTEFFPMGPNSAIYEMDPTGAAAPTIWLDLAVLFSDVDIAGPWSYDPFNPGAALPPDNQIGQNSLGDLDLSTDGRTMYVVNLYTNDVYAIPIAPDGSPPTSPSGVKTFPLPNPCTPGNGSNGLPHAAAGGLGVNKNNNRVYATITCNGPAEVDLHGYVYSFDPEGLVSQVMTQELDMDLNLVRPVQGSLPFPNYWNQSSSGGNFEPWLSNIDFSEDPGQPERIIIFAKNRKADSQQQLPQVSGGLIFTGCKNGSNAWQLTDGTYGCTGIGYFAPNAATNLSNTQTLMQNNLAGYYNYVGVEGVAVAGSGTVLPGFTELVAAGLDNIQSDSRHGMMWMSQDTGFRTRDVYLLNNSGNSFGVTKANAWLDVEGGCEAPPLEIGNLVWNDTNQNGIQDPGEAGIGGVTVNLYRDENGNGVYDSGTDTLVATAVTGSNGEYYFYRDGASLTGLVNNGPGFVSNENLDFFTNYLIAVDNTGDLSGGVLDGFVLTTGNVALGGDSDGSADPNNPITTGTFAGSRHSNGRSSDGTRDSDAGNGGTTAGSNLIAFSTGAPGENDHSYDIGFSTDTPPASDYSLGNRVWIEVDNDGIFEFGDGELPLDGVLMNLYADNGDGVLTVADGAPIASQSTFSGGFYRFNNLAAGEYIVEVDASNFSGGMLKDFVTVDGNDSAGMAPDPDNDVDNDDNGTAVAGFGVASKAVTLGGTEPDSPSDEDGPTGNTTIDFGFWCTSTLKYEALISNYGGSDVGAYDFAGTYDGARIGAGTGSLTGAYGMTFAPNREVLVVSSTNNKVLRFDPVTGTFLGELISGPPATVSVNDPRGITFGPDGNIYVTWQGGNQITRHQPDGTFIDVFVANGPTGLDGGISGIAFGPDGNLYASNYFADQIRRYDGQTGAYIDAVAVPMRPRDITWGPDGALYVTSETDKITRVTVGPTMVATQYADGSDFTYYTSSTFGPDGGFYAVNVSLGVQKENPPGTLANPAWSTGGINSPKYMLWLPVCEPPPCSLMITSGTPSSCSGGLYSADVTVDYTNPPAGGQIDIEGQLFTVDGTSPDTFTLTGLTCNSSMVDITATFVSDVGCTDTVTNLFIAPDPDTGASADLSITKTSSATTAMAGDQIIYTITVVNNGPSDTSGVAVTDQLPAGVTWVSDVPSQGSYNPGSGIWTIGNLTNGQSVTLQITVTIN